MKRTVSKQARVFRNLLILILIIFAAGYFSGLPIPIPELRFRREEKAHLVGPGKILGREEIDFSYYTTMIVAETEEGVILWVAGQGIERSDLVYREKNGENLLVAAPGYLGYMTAADQIHLPLILFDSQPGAARAEIQFTLSEVINGEVFEKTYFLASDRQTTGYFLFMLDAGESDDERLTLQSFANIASEQGKRTNYSIPVQVRFYNGRGGLIAEETIIISGEPAE